MWVVPVVVVWDKLNDVSCHILAQSARVKSLVITVKEVHLTEVGITNAHNDDSNGELRAPHQLINSSRHIIDDTIS